MNDDLLTIVCPRQMRAEPVMLSCTMLLFLIATLVVNREALLDPRAWLPLVVILFMLGLALGILYRNLLFRDRLYIARDKQAWRAPAPFGVDEIVSVRRLPHPDFYSMEASCARLGLGQGLIEIETSTERFRFGVGLHEYAIEPTIERIAAFCSLQTRLGE